MAEGSLCDGSASEARLNQGSQGSPPKHYMAVQLTMTERIPNEQNGGLLGGPRELLGSSPAALGGPSAPPR